MLATMRTSLRMLILNVRMPIKIEATLNFLNTLYAYRRSRAKMS